MSSLQEAYPDFRCFVAIDVLTSTVIWIRICGLPKYPEQGFYLEEFNCYLYSFFKPITN